MPKNKKREDMYNGDNRGDNKPLRIIKKVGKAAVRGLEEAVTFTGRAATLGQIPMSTFRFSSLKRKKK